MSGEGLRDEAEGSGADANASYLPLLPGRGNTYVPNGSAYAEIIMDFVAS